MYLGHLRASREKRVGRGIMTKDNLKGKGEVVDVVCKFFLTFDIVTWSIFIILHEKIECGKQYLIKYYLDILMKLLSVKGYN